MELLDDLGAAVEGLLGLDDQSLAALDDHSLDGTLVELERLRSRLALVSARVARRWDARRVWTSDGSRTAAGRLARDAGCSGATARATMRRARALDTLVHTDRAVASGRLSIDHLDLLARADEPWRHTRLVRAEAELVELCSTLPFADAERALAYWCNHADEAVGREPDGVSAAERARLQLSTAFAGTVVLQGELDPIGGEIVRCELQRLVDELRLVDRRSGITRTPTQRRAAALIEMARRSATTPADGRRPRPLFTVLVGDQSLQRLCELAASGAVLPEAALTGWLADADLETVLFDGPATVLSVSRRRTFTGAVRRAVEVRDRRCQHPSGCDVPAHRCDVDHITPFRDGGVTSQFNGRLECPTHNRLSDRHDHDARPAPERDVDVLDTLRARLRWQNAQHARLRLLARRRLGIDGGDSDADDGDADRMSRP